MLFGGVSVNRLDLIQNSLLNHFDVIKSREQQIYRLELPKMNAFSDSVISFGAFVIFVKQMKEK